MAFSANKLCFNKYNFEREPDDDDDAEEDKAEKCDEHKTESKNYDNRA